MEIDNEKKPLMHYLLPILSSLIIFGLSYYLEVDNQEYYGGIYYIMATLVWSFFIYLIHRKIKRFPSYLVLFFSSTILLGSSPLFENDHYRYIWEGKVWVSGENPYLKTPRSKELNYIKYDKRKSVAYKKLTTIYPPLALSWFALSSPFQHKFATILLQFLNILLLLIFLFQLKKLKVPPSLFYLFLPYWMKEYVAAVHIDFLAVILLIQFFIEIKKGRIQPSFLFWFLSFWTKYLAIFLLPVFIMKYWGQKKEMMKYGLLFLTSVILFFFLSGYNPFQYSGAKLFIQHWYWNPGFFGWINRYLGIHTSVARPLSIGFFFVSTIFYLFLFYKKKLTDIKYSLLTFSSLMFFAPVYNAFYTIWFCTFAIVLKNKWAIIYAVFSSLCYSYYSIPEYAHISEIVTHIWFLPFIAIELKKALT